MKNENPPRVTPQPEDIYGIVKEVACNSIANNSDPEFPSWGSDLSRALVKHTVMTTPYGAALYGMRDPIHEELKKHVRVLSIKNWKGRQICGLITRVRSFITSLI